MALGRHITESEVVQLASNREESITEIEALQALASHAISCNSCGLMVVAGRLELGRGLTLNLSPRDRRLLLAALSQSQRT